MLSELIQLEGTANEVGYQYGVKCKDRIHRLLAWYYSNCSEACKMDKHELLHTAGKYWSFIEEYSTEVADEIRGTAEGSEKNLNEIVFLNTYYEIYARPAFQPKCTAFAISGEATSDGTTYVAQNWDDLVDWFDEKFIPLFLRVKHKNGPEIISFTLPGIPATTGINSNGIGFCSNTLYTVEHKIGVPIYAISTDLLHQKTIGDALDSITRADRADSLNYLLGDENGETYDVEATPKDVEFFSSSDYLHHTNHFLSEKLQSEKDLVLPVMIDSVVRCNRIRRLLRQNVGKINLEKTMAFLRDHVNIPNSICRHRGSKFNFLTAASMIFVPSRREAWFTHGNPCEVEFEKVSFKS